MENEFYTDEFEQLIKEKADQFRMYPSKRVWHSIYNNLHPSRRWPSVVMSLLLITSLMLIGHLNTSDNTITRQINPAAFTEVPGGITQAQNTNAKKQNQAYIKTPHQSPDRYHNAFEDVLTDETDFSAYTVVKNNRPNYYYTATNAAEVKITTDKTLAENNGKDLIQSMDTYIKSNQIFADIVVTHKKNKPGTSRTTTKNTNRDELSDADPEAGMNMASTTQPAPVKPVTTNTNKTDIGNLTEGDKKINPEIITVNDQHALTNEEKAWIENFALQNKPAGSKWKGRLAYQFYATPAVNYRKLSTNSKGSVTPFANSDINNSISQKPGFGFEAGGGLTYSYAKNLLLKAGIQFNYTNYNIDADQTNHPILTTILLNDPYTGYSYSAARTSTTSNAFNAAALQPITLHNRTYQVSLPVGLAYKLSSQNNVEWFAGASVQPTYVFGGKAHLISSDLKSYVSDPSTIRPWNLNLGFETYMNFKLGGYSLQVGPQVRYQIFSTYRKDVALIEKPYAVGLKLGLTKGF